MDNLTPIENLKGIGDKTAGLFHKLGIFNCADLLNYYPRAYDFYEQITDIKSSAPGERNAIVCTVKSTPKIMRYNSKSIVSFFVTDSENVFEVKFFNAPYMLKSVKVGDRKVFRGVLRAIKDRLVMDQPKMYSPDEYSKLEGTITPVYSLTKDLSNDRISKCVNQVLNGLSLPPDYMTAEELKEFSLSDYATSLKNIHFPASYEAQYYARRRIVFEEFLYFVRIAKEGAKENINLKNTCRMIEVSDCKRLEESLPYSLTNAQKRAIRDIFDDMSGDYLMNRLVQGDVGSGKTIVAVMAMLMCAANGYQCAMMAPTEVLAVQHFKTVNEYISKYGLIFKPVLLTGQMKAADRREALAKIESGEANLIIGTHALIQENVSYKNLALVVTDEQHRFGVRQRQALAYKGKEPHILVMSATPIPRTLAIILYGDLQLSAIHELPAGRSAIKNAVVGMSYRPSAYKFFKDQITEGHQVYVICPKALSDEEDDGELENVVDYAAKLREILPGVNIEHLNGKMKAQEKTDIMQRFSRGETDILVSTTVIEVGINVPNATVMMIENAERFGLSQLHQLRGRVGRGSAQSYCIFISSKEDDKIMERLNVLKSTNDGFKIASEDLRLRGPGDFFGVRQSGEFAFKIADIYSDSDLLESAGNFVDEILKDDPRLERSENRLIKEQVDYFFEHSELFTSI